MAIHAPTTGALPGATPLPYPWVSIGDVLASRSRVYVEDAIEALVGYLDSIDGDADTEDDDPTEHGGDHLDFAWIERPGYDHGREREHHPEVCDLIGYGEDAEDDDSDNCMARDDDLTDWGSAIIITPASIDDENVEPSLGSIGDDRRYSQEHWAVHGAQDGLFGNHLSDREWEHDGSENGCLFRPASDL